MLAHKPAHLNKTRCLQGLQLMREAAQYIQRRFVYWNRHAGVITASSAINTSVVVLNSDLDRTSPKTVQLCVLRYTSRK